MNTEERAKALEGGKGEVVPVANTNPVHSVKNTFANIKDFSGILKSLNDFEKSSIGKIILHEFLGSSYSSNEPGRKPLKIEVLLKNLRDFLLPLMVVGTMCFIAFHALGFYIGW